MNIMQRRHPTDFRLPFAALVSALVIVASCGEPANEQTVDQTAWDAGEGDAVDVTSFFGENSQNVGTMAPVPGGILVTFDLGVDRPPSLARCELGEGCRLLTELKVSNRRLHSATVVADASTGVAFVVATSCPKVSSLSCSEGSKQLHALRVDGAEVDLRATLGAGTLPSLDGEPPIATRSRFINRHELAIAVSGNGAMTVARVDLETGHVASASLASSNVALASLSSDAEGSILVAVSERAPQGPVVRRPGEQQAEPTGEAEMWSVYALNPDGRTTRKQLPASTDRVIPYWMGLLRVTDEGEVVDVMSGEGGPDLDPGEGRSLSDTRTGGRIECEGSPGHEVLVSTDFDFRSDSATATLRWINSDSVREAGLQVQGNVSLEACAAGDAVVALVMNDTEVGLEKPGGDQFRLQLIE